MVVSAQQTGDTRTRRTGEHPAARGGRENRRESTVRRCIASGELRPKAELIRFVAGPDGDVVPDLAERLPGRGLWLSPRREDFDRACKRNLFARAAKAPLRVPADLAERVDGLLTRRCLETIGLARRSGQAVSGYEKVAASLASGGVAVLLAAIDATEEGRRKLRAAARMRNPAPQVVELFTAEELGRALGYGARVHAAIAPGGFAERFVKEATRLSGLRGELRGDHG